MGGFGGLWGGGGGVGLLGLLGVSGSVGGGVTGSSLMTVKEESKSSFSITVSSPDSPTKSFTYHLLFPAVSPRNNSSSSYVPLGSYSDVSNVKTFGFFRFYDVVVRCLLVDLFTKVA